jgi:hypothetical protein
MVTPRDSDPHMPADDDFDLYDPLTSFVGACVQCAYFMIILLVAFVAYTVTSAIQVQPAVAHMDDIAMLQAEIVDLRQALGFAHQ